ncbi:ATP-dependent Clp protease proteolytic subunit, partial [Campylobacter jejuni]
VQGSCYGNKDEMLGCIREIESLEDTLCEMYAARMGRDKDEIRSLYFDGKDHWLRADEALALGLIDGIYDADPVPED